MIEIPIRCVQPIIVSSAAAPKSFGEGLLGSFAKLYFYHIDTCKMKEACTLSKLGPSSLFCLVVLPYSTSLVPLNSA